MMMMMMKTEMAAVFVNTLLLLCCCFITSTVSQENVYAAAGEDVTLRLKNKLDSSERLYWKHNGTQIALMKSGRVVIGVDEGLGTDGSLTLRDLKKGSVEVYTSQIFKGGNLEHENTFIVRVLDKVQKPTLVATCEKHTETFKCQVPQAEGLTIAWLQDEKPLKETGPTLTRDPKKLTAESSFKCNVSNHISFEISQPVKKTCPVPDPPATKELFGFDFWTMVGILAGGGGLVLLLIIVTIVLCTRARRRRHNRLKAEGRGELEMAWSNQQ
ncbi:uncharacterized protein LOC115373191 [Myripristis murdjan]|nr:uncharacterized protein LOC115373191 [Myripristis murdjan]